MADSSSTDITVTWKINTLDRITSTGEIQTIHYTVDATDGVYRSGAYGSIGLDPADPDNMTPYSDVSEEQCLDWLFLKLGEETIENVENALENQISEQRNPTRGQGTPWSQQA